MTAPPRSMGVVAIVAGAILVVIGLVGFVRSGGASSAPTTGTAAAAETTGTLASTTAPSLPATPTTSSAATSTAPPSTTAGSTTTTTTTTTPTTTTLPPAQRVEAFVATYAAALASDDVDGLLSTLHPVVVDGYGAELCRTWIANEIVAISDYRLTGPVDGPFDQPFTTPAGSGTIPDAYSAPIAFSFRGEAFEATGGFADVEGEIRWLGQCR